MVNFVNDQKKINEKSTFFFVTFVIFAILTLKMLNNMCIYCWFWSKIEKTGFILVKNLKI